MLVKIKMEGFAVLELKIKLYEKKDIAALEEYLRRSNLHSDKIGNGSIDFNDTASVLLRLALDENPADKYYSNYANKQA